MAPSGTVRFWTMATSLHAFVPATGWLSVTEHSIRFEPWFLWRVFAGNLIVPLKQVLEVQPAVFLPGMTGGILVKTASDKYQFQVSPWRRRETIEAINSAIAERNS